MGKNKRNRRNKQKSKVGKAAKKTFAAGSLSSSASINTLIKHAVVRLKNRKGSTPPEIRACITSSINNLPKKFPSKLNKILMTGFPGLIKVENMNKNRGAAFNLKRTRFKYQPPAESVPVHVVAAETTTVAAVSEEAGGVFVEKVVDEVVEKERQSLESSTTTTTTTTTTSAVMVKPVVDLSIMRENIKRRKLERDGAAAQAGGWNIDREGTKVGVTN